MTEPSEEAMRVWEEAYAACMLGGLDERAAAAVIEAALAKAREDMRERCASTADRCGRPVGAGDGDTYVPGTSSQAAAAIRALDA